MNLMNAMKNCMMMMRIKVIRSSRLRIDKRLFRIRKIREESKLRNDLTPKKLILKVN